MIRKLSGCCILIKQNMTEKMTILYPNREKHDKEDNDTISEQGQNMTGKLMNDFWPGSLLAAWRQNSSRPNHGGHRAGKSK